MKTLYANGDSWTHGDEIAESLDDRDKCSIRYYNTWPWFLSQIKDIPVCVNDAQGGASNTRIFRRTNDFIFRWLSNNRSAKDLFVCIGWTTPERNEAGSGDAVVSIRAQGVLKLNQMPVDDRALERYQQAFYEVYSDAYGENQTLMYMMNLRTLCKSLGIKYYDFIAIGNQPQYWNDKSLSKWNMPLDNMYKEDSWNGVVYKNNWPRHQYKHPTKETQLFWAEKLAGEL
jgi:hypothetical protein